MRRAVRRLFEQLSTERRFGWYVSDTKWRQMMRALYPIEWVSAHHRQDFPPSLINNHARRVMVFNAGLRE